MTRTSLSQSPSGSSPSYYCYIVQCADGSYYTGWSTDPKRREKCHNQGQGARYTRAHRPVTLVYVEPQPDLSTAMKREVKIKAMPREKKEKLIQHGPGLPKDA
jgi:putative endonuclease